MLDFNIALTANANASLDGLRNGSCGGYCG
jgi:hypothetical protein